MTVTVDAPTKRGSDLVSIELYERLVDRIVKDEGLSKDLANRILDQALAFLAACATSDRPLAPSDTVDIGWHTFILYTRDYHDFCHQVAGRFIHHDPTDSPETTPVDSPAVMRERTISAIRAAGYLVDDELWAGAADCTQCADGCTHSGGGEGSCHFRSERSGSIALTVV